MDNSPTTREDIGSIVALIILLNCFFFNNNAYVLFGVSAWMLFWGIHTKQFKREKFTTRRAIIGALLLLVTAGMAVYMILRVTPAPLPAP